MADGAGHYPGLELINYICGREEVSLPRDETVSMNTMGAVVLILSGVYLGRK